MAQVFNADEVFAIGVQIEKNGREFYMASARLTQDSRIKDLFAGLADWESRHVELFERLRSNLPVLARQEDVYDPDNAIHLYLKAAADGHIFLRNQNMEALAASCETPIKALDMALGFEKESVVFYSSMKEIVPDDLGKDEIEKLIHEELIHIGQLTKEIQKLKKNIL